MLLTLNFQLGELTTFDSLETSATLVPEPADGMTAQFADLLQAGTEAIRLAGEVLPATGKGLPVEPPEVAGRPGVESDPEAIVASLNEQLAALLDEQVPTQLPGEALQKDASASIDPVPLPVEADNVGAQGLEIDPDLATELVNPPPPRPVPGQPGTPADPVAVVAPDVKPSLRQGQRPAPQPVPAAFDVSDAAAEDIPDKTLEWRPAAPASLKPVTSSVEQAAVAADTQLQLKPASPVQAQPQNLGGLAEAAMASAPRTSGPAVATPAVPVAAIDVPVQDSGWDQHIAERVIMMTNRKLQNAEIRLTPAELGPLRVQLAVDDGAAHVIFQAQHAVTREAIEQALPRLREMLAENGLTLGNTDVSDAGVHQREREAEADGNSPSGPMTADGGDTDDTPAADSPARMHKGLVDTFV